MPSTRQIIKDDPVPSTRSRLLQAFQFPPSAHLLITTPRHIFAWDASGVQPIFRSRKGSIIAAREAKDGSGILAVASSNVVVLHDTKRGKQESWGLNAAHEDDEVRHLEYGPDAKSLFMTTTTDGAVQHYSTEKGRMLEPAEKLAMPPGALAVSPTGHLVLSTEHDPPVIHLRNMTTSTASSRIHPNASSAPISCAVFHPERPNVFLVAFRDGTVAAYDTARLPRRDFGVHAEQGLKDGEIGHLPKLHRGIVGGDASLDKSNLAAPIVGIALLPGFKTRAVTAGRDGKCKIIDFTNGGAVLRTWHAKATLTSVSVVAVKSEAGSRSARGSRRSQASAHTIGGPTNTDSLIALGRVDGKVQIYDTVGLMLTQTAIAGQEEKILSVEWVKGDSPRSFESGEVGRHFSDASVASLKTRTTNVTPTQQPSGSMTNRTPTRMPEVERPIVVQSTRKLVVHPDEMEEEGTVRRKLVARSAAEPLNAALGYQDLFSPIKQEPVKTSTQKYTASPHSTRPRLSSQTFVRSPPSEPRALGLASAGDRISPRAVESHATSSESMERRRRKQQTAYVTSARRKSKQFAPLDNSTRRISFARDTMHTGDGTVRSREITVPSKPSANAKVLADLRRLARNNAPHYGAMSTHATSHRYKPASTSNVSTVAYSEPQHLRNHPAPEAPTQEVHVGDPDTWPTDSVLSSLADNEDIWLTSDSNDDGPSNRRRKARTVDRPPGRQTSRSKVDHVGGTMSTAASNPATHHITHPTHLVRVDGSTEEEMFSANSHLSPDGTFSPASEDVRELFPRSSSLSPRKHAGSKKRKTNNRVLSDRTGLALTAMSLNQALGRQPKSPWAKVKAIRRAPSPQKPTTMVSRTNHSVSIESQPISGMDGLVKSPSYTCLTCPETKIRLQSMENEVAILTGEVLAMKAILRRNGLPFPACLR